MPISVLDKGHECSNCRFSRPGRMSNSLSCRYAVPVSRGNYLGEWPDVDYEDWCGNWLATVSERFAYTQLSQDEVSARLSRDLIDAEQEAA